MKMKARAVVGKGEKGLRLVTLDLTVRLGREKEKQNVAKVIDGMMSTQTKKKGTASTASGARWGGATICL